MNTEPRNVLFALSPETKETFFPHFDQIALPGANVVWQDTSDLKSADWTELLSEKRVEILVTGWFTPGIPESVTDRADLTLRYVCHLAGSVRSFLPRKLLEHGTLVTNWGTAVSYIVAEHAILLVLGSLRAMPQWRSRMEAAAGGEPQPSSPLRTRSLRGQRVGLHGFGAIAREIVALLKPFGVSLCAYSAGVPSRLFSENEVRECTSLEDLFSTSDVLIECEALTPETHGCVTRALLERLPDQAVFVNVGRGAVVDEDALGQLASEGKIRAGLDVFREEPLRANSLLLANPETLLSPHIAGPTQDSFAACGGQALKNLRYYLTGARHQMEGVITTEIYDRST